MAVTLQRAKSQLKEIVGELANREKQLAKLVNRMRKLDAKKEKLEIVIATLERSLVS